MVNQNPEPTLFPNQGIFNLSHNIDMVWEQLAFDDTKLDTAMEIQIGSGVGNWTTDLQIRSLTSKKSDTLITPPQRTPQYHLFLVPLPDLVDKVVNLYLVKQAEYLGDVI